MDFKFVGTFLDVGQAHARAETQFARQRAGRGPAILHGQVNVFDARTVVHRLDADLVRLNRDGNPAAQRVNDDVVSAS